MRLADALPGALVLAPMTRGSNLPYRRLCVELGARICVSEMVIARRLKQRRRGELALVRRAPDEPCFGVQLAGNQPDEMAWAAAFVEQRGVDFVDVNLGCPIDLFTRRGLGAALARQPAKVARVVAAMCRAVAIPVTVKIRLGWNDSHRNALEVARAAVDAGAAALTVHGRTREARYRHPADWHAIAEIAAAVPIPVIGNGDLLNAHEVRDRLATSGCVAAMTARGALIKPWIFREVTDGPLDPTGEERLAVFRRYVELAREHWGQPPGSRDSTIGLDEYGRTRLREFLRWHVGFWVRYSPRRPDGTWPTMQHRESRSESTSALDALLGRTDEPALDFLTDGLLDERSLEGAPPPGAERAPTLVEAG